MKFLSKSELTNLSGELEFCTTPVSERLVHKKRNRDVLVTSCRKLGENGFAAFLNLNQCILSFRQYLGEEFDLRGGMLLEGVVQAHICALHKFQHKPLNSVCQLIGWNLQLSRTVPLIDRTDQSRYYHTLMVVSGTEKKEVFRTHTDEHYRVQVYSNRRAIASVEMTLRFFVSAKAADKNLSCITTLEEYFHSEPVVSELDPRRVGLVDRKYLLIRDVRKKQSFLECEVLIPPVMQSILYPERRHYPETLLLEAAHQFVAVLTSDGRGEKPSGFAFREVRTSFSRKAGLDSPVRMTAAQASVPGAPVSVSVTQDGSLVCSVSFG